VVPARCKAKIDTKIGKKAKYSLTKEHRNGKMLLK
jgi:hypothetical protein